MKNLIVIAAMILSTSAMATQVKSTKNQVNVARVVELVKLVNKPDIEVNVTVTDLGGSTDLSPTQQLFVNLYSKGEMFSTDASFDLGYIFSLKGATRVSGGVYEIKVVAPDAESGVPKNKILRVDAQKAIVSIKAVTCDDFDCDASTNFESSIDVSSK